MVEFTYNNAYAQPFYFGNGIMQDTYPHAPAVAVDPCQSFTSPENSTTMIMPQPYHGEGGLNLPYRPSLNCSTAPYAAYGPYGEHHPSGLLSTSTNPPTSLAPSAFFAPAQSSNYSTHSPIWSTDSPTSLEYCPCDQYVPVQMPELGYDSASPIAEEVPYSRMVLSESPRSQTEQNGSCSSAGQSAGLEEDSENTDPCYAELLRKCLLEAPNYTMSLRDLYSWVAVHSPKAKDPSNIGWKNSVRHNLSMNQGFERLVDKSLPASGSGVKNRSFWRLTEDAVLRGIQSTTRYRKGDGKRKSQRNNRHGTPDDKRVKSGAKGGQATRRLANRRAAVAARSTCSSSHQKNRLDEPCLPYSRIPQTPATPPITVAPFPEAVNPSYWNSIANIQDPSLYNATSVCKAGKDMDGFYTYAGTDYIQQPLSWSQSASPMLPAKVEGGWLGDPQDMGLSLSF